MKSTKARLSFGKAVKTLLAVLLASIFMLPLLWVFSNSLRPGSETFTWLDPISWQTFFPANPNFDNYLALADTSLGQGILNSLWTTLLTLVFGLALCSGAAYALAALEFRGRQLLFSVVIFSLLIPFDAIAIPLASMFKGLGLQNTVAGLILPGVANGMAIFLLRTFFLGIPKELVEASRIDGLNWFGVFFRIYLPLSKPALVGASLILFLFQWHAYIWPLLIGTGERTLLGPIALANMKSQYAVDFGLVFAGSVLLSVIPLALILVGQKYFIQSSSTSGIK
jgi:ABC-type glycerol-3-phosphate transport system permease component